MRKIIRKNRVRPEQDTYYIFQDNSGNPSGRFQLSPFIKGESIIISSEEHKSSSDIKEGG